MKKINIRGLATPLIIGAGLFVALTGLIMFFLTSDPFRFAHVTVSRMGARQKLPMSYTLCGDLPAISGQRVGEPKGITVLTPVVRETCLFHKGINGCISM